MQWQQPNIKGDFLRKVIYPWKIDSLLHILSTLAEELQGLVLQLFAMRGCSIYKWMVMSKLADFLLILVIFESNLKEGSFSCFMPHNLVWVEN
jgi:hypothetical protein